MKRIFLLLISSVIVSVLPKNHFQNKKNVRSKRADNIFNEINGDCQKGTGDDYSGTGSKTKTGFSCLEWRKSPEPEFKTQGDHNYCRNPDNEDGVWCYSTNPDEEWELCDIPVCVTTVSDRVCGFCDSLECSVADAGKSCPTKCKGSCQKEYGNDYLGTGSKTKSGFPCQKWSSSPEPEFKILGDHNYCRNPDNDDGVWCYSTNPDEEWEYCDVPVCGPDPTPSGLIILGTGKNSPECNKMKEQLSLTSSVKVLCLTPKEDPHFCLQKKIQKGDLDSVTISYRSWYDTCEFPGGEGENKTQLDVAVKMLEDHIEDLWNNDGIKSENIVLAGFSTGGSLSLYTALHSKYKLGGFIGIATWLPLLTKEPPTQFNPANSETPLLHINAHSDKLVTVKLGNDTAQELSKVIPDYTFDLVEGVHETYLHNTCIFPKISNWLSQKGVLEQNCVLPVPTCEIEDQEGTLFDFIVDSMGGFFGLM